MPRDDSDYLTDRLLEELDGRGLSSYHVCKAAGVPASSLTRLRSGRRRSLRSDVLSRLCVAAGLVLVPRAGRRATKRPGEALCPVHRAEERDTITSGDLGNPG